MLRVADHTVRSDTGRQRSGNEDSYRVQQPLFVVADGMGGAQAGEVASRTAVDVFAQGLTDGPGSNEARLVAMVAEANTRIHALAQTDEHHAGMGTTLTAAYVGEQDLAVAHVGDSRLYVLRDGELSQLTDDHSLVGELVRRGQISAEEAEEHPQRSIITRALGPEHEVVIDHYSWPVRDGDVFLLCSDGLTSMIADEKVAEILREADALATAGQRLVQAANDAGGRDNITVILFRVEEVTPRDGGVLAASTTVRSPVSPAPAVAAPDETASAGPIAPAPGGPGPPTGTAVRERAAPPKPLTTVLPRVPRPATATAAPPPARPRRRPRVPGPAKAAAVVIVLLALVASGAWIASRSVYFVGTDDEGFVTLYQGLPYDLPGLSLYQEQFTSGVPAQTLSPRLRRTVTEHKLRSQKDAVDLVRQLERGDLAGQP